MYPSGSPRWVQPWLKTMKQLLMLSTELLFTQTSHLCFLRWHSTEHQRYRSDPVDLQWGRFCAEGSDGSVPGGTACHPDRLRGHGGGRRGCRQGRTGPCGRPTRRRPQLGAAVDSLAWITQVESDSDSDSLIWTLFLHTTSVFCWFLYERRSSDSAPVVSVTCTGAGTSSCRRPTMRAGASVSWGATRRVTASSLSSSKPLCRVRLLTLTDASSKLRPIRLLYDVTSSCILSSLVLARLHVNGLWFSPGAVMRSWQWTEPQQWEWTTLLSSPCSSCRRIKSRWLWCPGLGVFCSKTHLSYAHLLVDQMHRSLPCSAAFLTQHCPLHM